ncbi:hypothetical protein UFOVP1290_432 [uncultured Caudovirales phage]|uniref:Uncharacterized protein n=1 Tax=uncultured Caudovirales phage TaxID=2100421 RepID=A0A6J5RLH2_9CAUD|nr:hypothetical protein UFOVP1290_432 [uncultured Caudovirales phage]
MKNKKQSITEQEVENLLFEYWLKIDLLRGEIEKKNSHMKMLLDQKLTPFFADDPPINEWTAILRYCNSIATLKVLESKIKHRKFLSRKKK